MGFANTLKKYMDIYSEAGEEQSALPPQDAAAPAPATEQPAAAADKAPQSIPPEGYVDIVRMLAKALVMNIPAGAIDDLFTIPITKENATEVREGLQAAIAANENYQDNPQKIQNPHFENFVRNINENNFMAKYKEILNIMKRYSNDIAA
jgi:phospholipase/lecithinase/hemolysin